MVRRVSAPSLSYPTQPPVAMNRFLLLTLLLLPAMPIAAQTPVFKIEDNTGMTLLLVNAGGVAGGIERDGGTVRGGCGNHR